MREKLPLVFAAMLVFLFGFRVLTPAHEYMMRPEMIMSFVFDTGILLGLIGARAKLPGWIFWPALACGLGLFLIRGAYAAYAKNFAACLTTGDTS